MLVFVNINSSNFKNRDINKVSFLKIGGSYLVQLNTGSALVCFKW